MELTYTVGVVYYSSLSGFSVCCEAIDKLTNKQAIKHGRDGAH